MKIENMQLRRKCDRLRSIRDISGEWVLFEETITVRSTRKCQRTGGAAYGRPLPLLLLLLLLLLLMRGRRGRKTRSAPERIGKGTCGGTSSVGPVKRASGAKIRRDRRSRFRTLGMGSHVV